MDLLLDLERWPRRAAFEHFLGLAQPFFSLCASVDVSRLAARVKKKKKGQPGATLFLAYHHAALAAANAVEPFRYELAGRQVRVRERVDGSTTLLREDESISFVDLPYEREFGAFVERALPLLAAARHPAAAPDQAAPRSEAAAVMHMTTIPWLTFSSFSHARGAGDTVPKLAFGRIEAGRMPVALEVHHALMDGLHVGRFYAALQAALDGD
jgi:chloramphenicol O-acetyltransferase type A